MSDARVLETGLDQPLNNLQKLAEATHGVITPANILDVAGMAGAKYGLDRIDSWPGIGMATGSFMVDFADGILARWTGTTSEIGKAMDHGGDKVKLGYAIPKVWEKGLAPKTLIAAIAIQNAANAALTVADRMQNENPAIEVSQSGRAAIFLQQWGLGLHVIGSEVKKRHEPSGKAFKVAGTVLGVVGLGFGAKATAGYYKQYRDSRREAKDVPQISKIDLEGWYGTEPTSA